MGKIYTEKSGRSRLFRWFSTALSVVIFFLFAALAVKVFFVASVTVNQTSMAPTYADGERLYVNRLGRIERGKVVVFFSSDVSFVRLASSFPVFSGNDAVLLVKRVVALSGDELWLEENEEGEGWIIKIRRAEDGEVVGESYTDADGNPVALDPITLSPDTAGVLYDATRWDPYTVGADCIFTIGDNRRLSQDSRVYGDVPRSRVVGTVI